MVSEPNHNNAAYAPETPDLVARFREAEERQKRSLAFSESITAANIRFIETGSITQMTQILVDTCMTITNSPFGMLIEQLPDNQQAIQALSLASFDPISELPLLRDIQYEIRRNGSYSLSPHQSRFTSAMAQDRIIIADTPAESIWHDCQCELCSIEFTTFMGIPLKLGNSIVGQIVLANRDGGYRNVPANELETYARTCALVVHSARADKDRDEARENLRQAQKMEAIGQLAGGIAHDFNNLLTVINGYSTLVLQKISDNELLKKEVEQILNAGERAATLVRQLLAFGRRQVLEPRQINVNTLIAGLHKILCRLIGEHITITTQLCTSLDSIKADPGQIEQIIMNLVISARDRFERSGGNITVETANVVLDEAFVRENRGSRPGQCVMISIKDNGLGISQDKLERIFEPFSDASDVTVSSGLGLAPVYGIVKQSGGYIQVRNERGIGTEFRVYFPRLDASEPEQFHPVAQTTGTTSPSTSMVLIVEDEKSVLDMAAFTLRALGFTVLTAGTPGEAIKIFEHFSDDIDLLLTDVILPEMTGPEMAQTMLSRRPDLPVVFMSGYADGHSRASSFFDETVPFIMKPFNPVDMGRIVQQTIAGKSRKCPEGTHA